MHTAIVETQVWHSLADAQSAATRLAAHACIGQATIELQGDLGAGKTTFTRYLLQALGVTGRIKSPTYAVVEAYELDAFTPPMNIWHFDFYRFNDVTEWEEAGFREIFASPGLKLMEWADKARAALPVADLVITLTTLDEAQREVRWTAQTSLGERLIRA